MEIKSNRELNDLSSGREASLQSEDLRLADGQVFKYINCRLGTLYHKENYLFIFFFLSPEKMR